LLAECLLASGRAGDAARALGEAVAVTESAPGLAAQPKRWRKLLWRQWLVALRQAGDAPGAARVTQMARERFPEDADFAAAGGPSATSR
jgi:hypothetical protein